MRITESQLRKVIRKLVMEQAGSAPVSYQDLLAFAMPNLKDEMSTSRSTFRDRLKKLADLAQSDFQANSKLASDYLNYLTMVQLDLAAPLPQFFAAKEAEAQAALQASSARQKEKVATKAASAQRGEQAYQASLAKHESGPRFTQADVAKLQAFMDGASDPGLERRFNAAVRADFKFGTRYLADDLVALGFDEGEVNDMIAQTEENLGLGFGSSGYYGSYSGTPLAQRKGR